MSCGVDAGALDQRITLQAPSAAVDGLGQRAGAWTTVAEVWARAEPLRGRDFFAAAQMQAAADVKFTLRYRPDVLATWRVLWDGRPYEIVGQPINVRGQKVVLEIMATQGVRDGRD